MEWRHSAATGLEAEIDVTVYFFDKANLGGGAEVVGCSGNGVESGECGAVVG